MHAPLSPLREIPMKNKRLIFLPYSILIAAIISSGLLLGYDFLFHQFRTEVEATVSGRQSHLWSKRWRAEKR